MAFRGEINIPGKIQNLTLAVPFSFVVCDSVFLRMTKKSSITTWFL